MTTYIESFATPAMWSGFIVFIIIMLTLDLFLFGGNKVGKMKTSTAFIWVFTWMSLAFIFAGCMWLYLDINYGSEIAKVKTLEFITGYIIEQTLSIDNMFVFVMIFSFFAVPVEFQRRVLLWGVIGAIVMRALMILLGVFLISKFSWILYIFGAFLVFTAIKMLIVAEQQSDLEKNPLLLFLRKRLRITPNIKDEKFFIKKDGVVWATPLFLVLLFIEFTDVIFAVDSIPAIFAVTRDPFIVFTSNMFAIMGLRALYFLLANMHKKFHLLKYGLAIVLLFIGIKLLLLPWFHFPISWSLLFVVIVIASSIGLSFKYVK